MELDDLIDELRAALPDVLVAVDFDGTLAPLVADPQQSRPVPGAVAALTALARTGAQVAVVTGRDAHTAVRLGELAAVPGIVVAGLYGVETWRDGELVTPETPPPMAELRRRLPELLESERAHPAVWIEDKRLSHVVHGRRADDPDAALAPLRQPISALADDLGLELHPGRDVLELRLPGYDKAGALRRLADDHRGVLYLGDDLGDLPAFAEVRAMRERGRAAWSVGVLSSQVSDVADSADVCVPSPVEVVALLHRLAGGPD